MINRIGESKSWTIIQPNVMKPVCIQTVISYISTIQCKRLSVINSGQNALMGVSNLMFR